MFVDSPSLYELQYKGTSTNNYVDMNIKPFLFNLVPNDMSPNAILKNMQVIYKMQLS